MMLHHELTKCVLVTFVLSLPNAAHAIPWPVGTSGPDTANSHTLMNTYGEMNNNWENVGPGVQINFHTGIDLHHSEVGSESVWCVEGDVITDCHSFTNIRTLSTEWVAVISPSTSADSGWCYCHVEGEDGDSIQLVDAEVGDSVDVGDHIGTMTEITPKHLHFARTGPEAPFGYPGIDNPLDYLLPPATDSAGYTWQISSPASNKPTFFLPDYPAFADPGEDSWETLWQTPGSVYSDTLNRDSLVGGVDLFYEVVSNAQGSSGYTPDNPTMPQRIHWSLSGYSASGWTELFERFLVDLDGELGNSGSSPSDWMEYKRLYFKYLGQDMEGGGPWAYVTCLTNCGDDTSWNGISNIEEGCWQTDSDWQGSGSTSNPVLAMYPDGPYQVEVTSYAWDTTQTHEVTLDVELANFSPVVSTTTITDQADGAVWEAEWQAVETDRGLDAELVVLTNQSVQLGQTLDATVVFSEPMNTSSVEITAGKAPGYNDLTVTTTEWTCTSNPEPYYDTWNGTIEVPAEGCSGWITLKIDGDDSDGNCLKDPAGAFDERSYSDTYHGFGIVFGPEAGWPAAISDQCYGSPCLADVDGDGDLDVSVLCDDGYLEVLDDDGSALVGWQSGDWGDTYPTILKSTPAAADIDGDGGLEVLSVLTYGCTARDSYGAVAPGWPVYMEEGSEPGYFPGQTSPSVYDLDGDGELEVVLTRHKHNPLEVEATVFVYDEGGAQEWSSELSGSIDAESVISTPAIGDISLSRDGNELVICTSHYYETCADGSGASVYDSAIYLLGDD